MTEHQPGTPAASKPTIIQTETVGSERTYRVTFSIFSVAAISSADRNRTRVFLENGSRIDVKMDYDDLDALMVEYL